MSKRYRFVVEVEAEEQDALLFTEGIRLDLAQTVNSRYTPGKIEHPDEAVVVAMSVDGRDYDFSTHSLAEGVPQSVVKLIDEGKIMGAIKTLREVRPGITLAEAKYMVDNYRDNR